MKKVDKKLCKTEMAKISGGLAVTTGCGGGLKRLAIIDCCLRKSRGCGSRSRGSRSCGSAVNLK